MGTGWSQDEASQSQPNIGNPREPNPSSNAVSEVGKVNAVRNGASEAKSNGYGQKASDDHRSEKAVKAIHNLDAITANADSPLDRLSPEKLLTQLRNGVLLNQKKQKYWLDKMSKNCFMVYARDLSITWAENEQYWTWQPANDASDHESIEVAELVNVCWLEVCGKFDTKNLSPGTLYDVSIVAMVKQKAYGWDGIPANFVVNLPDGSKIETKVDVAVQPRDRWVEFPGGKFTTSAQNPNGIISFSLFEYHGGKWKRGLVIKGFKIQPAI